MDSKLLLIRIAVIVVGLCTALVCYLYIVKPVILEPLCLVNSKDCVRITYYNYENSVLAQMQNTGLWIWFNGQKVYIFGQPVGQICKDPKNYQAVYTINTKTGLKEGYSCVTTLEKVLQFYKDKNVQPNNILRKVNYNTFDIYSMLNLMNNEGIINL